MPVVKENRDVLVSRRATSIPLNVTFSEPILPMIPGDVVLTNLGVNAPVEQDAEVPLTGSQLSLRGNVLTISFDAYELPGGVYALELLPTVADLSINPLDGNGDGVPGDSFSIVGSSCGAAVLEVLLKWDNRPRVDEETIKGIECFDSRPEEELLDMPSPQRVLDLVVE